MFTLSSPPISLPLRPIRTSNSSSVTQFIIGDRTAPYGITNHAARRREKFAVATITEDMRDRRAAEIRTEPDEERPVSLGSSDEMNPLSSSPPSTLGELEGDGEKLIDRGINAGLVLAAGAFATTKLLTIDHDYWQGWTLYEVLRYAPEHSWIAYEEALQKNPVLAKMVISGVVYSLGDWIAQCFQGKPLFEFDRTRIFRSGLVGFTLHGSLSHYYYQICEVLIPFREWWVVPAKIVFDQTVWSAIWNSIYFVVVGLLRSESPANIYQELKGTFWSMLTAGWKLWPFAHLITYGVMPVEQRLLWVDCIELIWVTVLSTYSNEKSEVRISEVSVDSNSASASKDDKV